MVPYPRGSAIAALERKQRSPGKAKHNSRQVSSAITFPENQKLARHEVF
jgi:hypothetical protein